MSSIISDLGNDPEELTDAPSEEVLRNYMNACHFDGNLAIIVLGASGDLAKKKIYPVLWALFRDELLPKDTHIIGYARSELTHDELVERIQPYIKFDPERHQEKYDKFLSILEYLPGDYKEMSAFENLNRYLEKRQRCRPDNRIFYLAVPPSVFEPVTENIRQTCWSKHGWNRVIIEKPFGHDSESSQQLSSHLNKLFAEEDIYRIDHYLGKEMVQNLLLLRFGNRVFTPLWNREHIKAVQITFKEPFGAYGRGGYFDQYGIIRDVMQNHLLQVLTLVAMEKPVSTNADDIRAEKVRVLRCMQELKLEDVILGQYVANKVEGVEESQYGYTDDPQVPKDSKTPTFATALFHIKNERWDGVPFIMRCGKALNEKKAEVRIQFHSPPGDIFEDTVRNEIVIRIGPEEAVYLKMMVKNPGMGFEASQTELDLSYNARYPDSRLPDAYERLILNVVQGSQLHFVRTDELAEAWRIFTPALHAIDKGEKEPIKYKFGSRGPPESDDFIAKHGYVYTKYDWNK